MPLADNRQAGLGLASGRPAAWRGAAVRRSPSVGVDAGGPPRYRGGATPPVVGGRPVTESSEEAQMIVEGKLTSLGFPLPDLEAEYRRNASGAHFVSHRAAGSLLFLSGTVPIRDGAPYLTGLVGRDLTVPQGYEAARWALIPTLAAVRYALGDLDRVEAAIQMIGYVNSAPGFAEQPRVINGAADLLVELYGDRGKPTRAAIGCQGLALDSSVEIVLTVQFSGTEVRPPLARDRWVK